MYFPCLYNFWKSYFQKKETNPSFLLSRRIFQHFEELSLSLFLSKSTSSLGISLTFPPWGVRPWRRGRRLRLLFVTFHSLSSRFFQRLEYTFDYFSSFPSNLNRDPFLSNRFQRWSLANSRALKLHKYGDKGLERFWSIFENGFDRHRKCRTWMKPRQLFDESISNEAIKPRKWWSRVIFAYRMHDMIWYNWWTTDETRHDMFVIFQ